MKFNNQITELQNSLKISKNENFALGSKLEFYENTGKSVKHENIAEENLNFEEDSPIENFYEKQNTETPRGLSKNFTENAFREFLLGKKEKRNDKDEQKMTGSVIYKGRKDAEIEVECRDQKVHFEKIYFDKTDKMDMSFTDNLSRKSLIDKFLQNEQFYQFH